MSHHAYQNQAQLQAYQQYVQDQQQAYDQYIANMQKAAQPQYSQPFPSAPSSWATGWFDFRHPDYAKGLLIGAGVAYLATNPAVQKAIVKGAVSLWSAVQGGFEEVKEQIQDIKSEMSLKP